MTRLLLFTKTTGYRHDSMQDGIDLVFGFARVAGVKVEHTEDAAAFTAENLARFDAVVWFSVSGDVLDEDGRQAFGDYLRGGGGFAGVHGAADAEWSWPEYEDIVGARFLYHPLNELQRQSATVQVEATDPSTAPIPEGWSWADEWYAFKRDPGAVADVLLTIDEETYDPGEHPMGAGHPVSWRGRFGEGRTWYSALGHYRDSYADPVFRQHVWNGITSVLRTA